MTKNEIKQKFDEIVDFAGIELYVNTPVKRYSSGMYVRLAFAVAAHLEPEILIVDEVLAVGDADFQKKCLGKMGDVASHGRTIIFVSHNMAAVQSLCKSALYLINGQVADSGATSKVINTYLSKEVRNCLKKEWNDIEDAPGNDIIKIVHAELIPYFSENKELIDVTTSFDLKFKFYNNVPNQNINLSLVLSTVTGNCIFNVSTLSIPLEKGYHTGTLKIPGNLLNDEIYTVTLYFVKDFATVIFKIDDILMFEVTDEPRNGAWFGKWVGAVRPKLNFHIK